LSVWRIRYGAVLTEWFFMLDLLARLPPTDWLRLGVVYIHLLSSAIALATVLQADLRIVKGRVAPRVLRRTAKLTMLLLAALWVSGLLIIYVDTGFSIAALAGSPKLLLKLLAVLVLSFNGVLLHYLSFPVVVKRDRLSIAQTVLLATTGAMSTSHWLLAAFVGVASPLAQWPFDLLLAGYLAYSVSIALIAMAIVPVLRQRLSRGRSSKLSQACAVNEVDIDVLLLPDDSEPVPPRKLRKRARRGSKSAVVM